MYALLLKDLYCLKSYGKSVAIMLVMFGVISLNMENPAAYIGGFFSLWFVMMGIATFNYDDVAKWDHYARSLPLQRKEIVKSKYMLMVLCCSFGVIIAAVLGFIIMLFKPDPFLLGEQALYSVEFLSLSLLFAGLLLPLIFKFGAEKARLLIVGIVLLPFAILMLVSKLGFMPEKSTVLFMLGGLPIVAILL
ncbi:MAG: ABC-2 transporter permease, partial [Anaerovorax sp.]